MLWGSGCPRGLIKAKQGEFQLKSCPGPAEHTHAGPWPPPSFFVPTHRCAPGGVGWGIQVRRGSYAPIHLPPREQNSPDTQRQWPCRAGARNQTQGSKGDAASPSYTVARQRSRSSWRVMPGTGKLPLYVRWGRLVPTAYRPCFRCSHGLGAAMSGSSPLVVCVCLSVRVHVCVNGDGLRQAGWVEGLVVGAGVHGHRQRQRHAATGSASRRRARRPAPRLRSLLAACDSRAETIALFGLFQCTYRCPYALRAR